jgi:hypothetical protein
MLRSSQVVVTSSGKTAPFPLDRYVFGYAVGVTMKTAGVKYTVQQCLDDPFLDPSGEKYTVSYATSGAWIDSDDPVVVNASTSRTSNFSFPPRAVRLNVSAGVSAGNPVTFTIIPVGVCE